MKKEKLIINNFGPIKSIDLELGKMNILIGEQASGKSTIAKVLAICRYFSYIVDDSNLIGVNYQSSFVRGALKDWGLDGFENEDSYIFYENLDYTLKVISERTDFDNENHFYSLHPKLFPVSERFKLLLNEYESLKPRKNSKFGIYEDWSIPHTFLTTDVKKVMDNPFFFPTERGLQSVFSIGKRGLENLNDRLYEQLAGLSNLASNFKKETKIKPLGLDYKYEDGKGKFKGSNDPYYFDLTQGASGYQSSIPIILAIKYYGEAENRKRTFIVEEPEQNLFPKTQKKLMEFMVESINRFDNQFLIPTHSPYMLTSLSNLIYAYKVGNIEDGMFKDKVAAIIPKESWINVDDISVYFLNHGNAKNLVNIAECLIETDDLDGASEIINHEFDELLSLETSDFSDE